MNKRGHDQAAAVQRMQDYVEAHLTEPITLNQLAEAAGYSVWHASKLFAQVVKIQPLDYVRSRRMTKAAQMLKEGSEGVLDTALRLGFNSHEGFTRAFRREFGLCPSVYARNTPALAWFMPRSALTVHFNQQGETKVCVEHVSSAVFVRTADYPARKLVLVRAKSAGEYFAYCEEVGCDVWGLLSSLHGAIDEPKGLWLPDAMRPAGTSHYVMGVEVPLDWNRDLPSGCEIVELPESQYLVFQGQPYDDAKMGEAIGALRSSMGVYDPAFLGLAWAEDRLPSWQMAPMPDRGVIEGRPVRKL